VGTISPTCIIWLLLLAPLCATASVVSSSWCSHFDRDKALDGATAESVSGAPGWHWDYLLTEPFKTRHKLAATEFKGCHHILEIGASSRYNIKHALSTQALSVTVVDPYIEPVCENHPNSLTGLYRQIPSSLQSFTDPTHYDCLLALGIDCHSDEYRQALVSFVSIATTVVLGSAEGYLPSEECVQHILDSPSVSSHLQVVWTISLDLSNNSFTRNEQCRTSGQYCPWPKRKLRLLRRSNPVVDLGLASSAHTLKSEQYAQARQLSSRLGYHPSNWEIIWRNRSDDWWNTTCASLKEQYELSDNWLQAARDNVATLTGLNGSRAVLSHFGRSRHERLYIEPLVGVFRHPYSMSACTPAARTTVDILDTSYLILHNGKDSYFRNRFPGRKFLFDIGVNHLNRSPTWLYNMYAERGIVFDAIYGWEARTEPPLNWWSAVDPAIAAISHFYNIPAVTPANNISDPLFVMQQVCGAGSFIALKLDIDSPVWDVEYEMLKYFISSEFFRLAIGEVFVELHFNLPDMQPWWGELNTAPRLSYLLDLFKSIRRQGIRIHYWV
jgi:hypothetical protein